VKAVPGLSRSRTSVHFTLDVPVDLHRPADADGSLVVALHGMGMTEETFARDALPCVPPRATLLLPRAPLPYEIRGTGGPREGAAWYVYTGDPDAFLAAMARTEAWLLATIDASVRDAALDPSRVALLGFSQGGYLAGFTGLRHAARFRGLVVAGGRVKHEELEDAARGAPGFPLLHVHGAEDASVRPAPSRESVERVASWGVAAEFRSYACAHAVLRDPQCQADVREFLARVLR